jgi:ADP-heptose:LPS heptosyltransferase
MHFIIFIGYLLIPIYPGAYNRMKLWLDKGIWTGRRALLKAGALTKEEVRSIGVIKHAAYGDLLLTRPFFITLRDYFPKCSIKLSVISHYQKGIPDDLIDDIHIVNKNERYFYGFYKNYKQFGTHDILFDITATTPSFWISHLNKAKLKIGYIHKGIERLIYDVAVPRSCYKLEAETFLDQLLVLGLSYKYPLQFDLKVSSTNSNTPYLLYFPTASTAQKCWPWENYFNLIKRLCRDLTDYDHIILTGLADWEIELAKKIHQQIGLKNNLKLIEGGEETTKYVQHARLFISGDTGIRNLAITSYTPTVGIFFDTQPFRYLPRFGRHKAVYSLNGEAPSVEQVSSAVIELLSESRH